MRVGEKMNKKTSLSRFLHYSSKFTSSCRLDKFLTRPELIYNEFYCILNKVIDFCVVERGSLVVSTFDMVSK